jgi:hypothetical protein
LIILGGVDAALGGDGVRAAGRILKTEAVNLVTQFAQGGGGGGSCKAGSDNDDVVFALVRRVDQLEVETSLFPCLLMGPVGALESRIIYFTSPSRTLIGMEM